MRDVPDPPGVYIVGAAALAYRLAGRVSRRPLEPMRRISAFFLLLLPGASPTLPASADLFASASQGDITAVRQLLSAGADVNGRDPTGATALLYAVASNRRAMAQFLLDRHASVDLCRDDGASALHLAVARGELEIARVLLDAGADPEAEDDAGRTPLALAQAGTRRAVAELLEQRSAELRRADAPPATPDWPEWRGPLRCGTAAGGPPLADTWPDGGPRRLWLARDLPGGGNSSPVVANGRVYVYSHRRDPPAEAVVALDVSDGRKVWQRNFTPDKMWHEASASPCVAGDRVYVMGAQRARCLAAADGRPLWEYLPDYHDVLIGEEVSSSMRVAGGAAAACGGELFGLDAVSGARLWHLPLARCYSRVISSLGIWQRHGHARLIYAGAQELGCFDPRSGAAIWRVKGSGKGETYAPTPCIAGDTLVTYFEGALRCYRLRLHGPRELWSAPYFEEYASPAMWDGKVYTTGPAQAGGPYEVVCRDVATGRPLWRHEIARAEYSSPVAADGKVFAFEDNGRLLVMLDARTGRALGQAEVGALKWTTPTMAGGCLYVRTQEGVACYDLRAAASPTTASAGADAGAGPSGFACRNAQ